MTDHDFAMELVKLGNSIQVLHVLMKDEEQLNAMSAVHQRYQSVVDGWIRYREQRTNP